MLSCREATELVSQSFERRLSLRERAGMHLHLLICRLCARFKRQMDFLHAAARDYTRRGVLAARQLRLSPAARERIRRALRREG